MIDIQPPLSVREILIKHHYTNLSHEDRMHRLRTYLDQLARARELASKDAWDLPDSSLYLELLEVYSNVERVAELLFSEIEIQKEKW